MKKSPLGFCIGAALLAAGLLFANAGCASAPKARSYSIKITVDPEDKRVAGSSFQVDLIGANAVSDLPRLRTYSVTDYWKPGDAMRKNADKVVLEFGQGKSHVQILDGTNPAWARWLRAGALQLVVLVDLPLVVEPKPGNEDPRRLILDLDVKRWPRNVETIDLLVQSSGIRLLTPMKPLK